MVGLHIKTSLTKTYLEIFKKLCRQKLSLTKIVIFKFLKNKINYIKEAT